MATAIGTNDLNSIVRQVIADTITDNIYNANPLWFRMNKANRIMQDGGTQIEVPLMYAEFTNGGPYAGFDVLDVSPSNTLRNAAFNWKNYYVPVSIDMPTVHKASSSLAVANLLSVKFAQAEMQMSEYLGQGAWSDGVTNTLAMDGIKGAVDNGSINANYGGIARGSNTWWDAVVDTESTALTLTMMQDISSQVVNGGQHSTIIIGTQAIYNEYIGLNTAQQRFPVQEGMVDEQLVQAGFTNVVYNGIPMLVDPHCPAGSLYFLNENYMNLYVMTGVNFKFEDFIKPPNQDAATALLKWMGNLTFSNCRMQAVATGIA